MQWFPPDRNHQAYSVSMKKSRENSRKDPMRPFRKIFGPVPSRSGTVNRIRQITIIRQVPAARGANALHRQSEPRNGASKEDTGTSAPASCINPTGKMPAEASEKTARHAHRPQKPPHIAHSGPTLHAAKLSRFPPRRRHGPVPARRKCCRNDDDGGKGYAPAERGSQSSA